MAESMRDGRRACPACDSFKIERATTEVNGSTVNHWRCKRCEAIFGQMYLGDSYTLVLPWMVEDASTIPLEQARYFDFDCLGSKGVVRRHGWFDVISRRVVQVG